MNPNELTEDEQSEIGDRIAGGEISGRINSKGASVAWELEFTKWKNN